jgi:hypothetical protein
MEPWNDEFILPSDPVEMLIEEQAERAFDEFNRFQWKEKKTGKILAEVNFQDEQKDGPETGLRTGDLLMAELVRLRGLQKGYSSCRENSIVIRKIEEALHWIYHRKLRRARQKAGDITKYV